MPVGFRVLYADEQVQRLLPVNPKPKASPPSMSSMPTPLYAVYRMPMSKSSVSCSRLRVSLCSVRPCLSTHVPSLCSMRAYLGSQCASPGAPNMHLRGSCKYASSHFSALCVPISLAQCAHISASCSHYCITHKKINLSFYSPFPAGEVPFECLA